MANDKQAKIGCKGKNKYWYGYKQHASVDMQSGLINKVAITPANVTDAQGLKHVTPESGAIYDDKDYCTKPARHAAAKKQIYLAAIRIDHQFVDYQIDDQISKLLTMRALSSINFLLGSTMLPINVEKTASACIESLIVTDNN